MSITATARVGTTEMLSFDEALGLLLSGIRSVEAERVGLSEARGRVLAHDIVATRDLPAFDYSAMDGYAIRVEDCIGPGPFEFPVLGESAAGGAPPDLPSGSACRIFTGAEIPRGADAIVMQEDVERTDNLIRIKAAPNPFDWIRRRGADLASGSIALLRGTRLTPGRIALLAALDHVNVWVSRRPVVHVLCTGDELRSPGEPGRPGTIAESNGYYVCAHAEEIGAIARVLPFVPDNLEQATHAVRKALIGADLVVTIGGVSVGDHDVMRQAFLNAGVSLDAWRVAIKPGKPIAFAHDKDTLVIGLPGNPASASLTFLLFAAPALKALQGDREVLPRRMLVRSLSNYTRKPGRREFVRVTLEGEGPSRGARVLPNQASGAVTSFATADALLVLAEDATEIREGESYEAILL